MHWSFGYAGSRESPHIGDFARGLFPSTPEAGQFITLGEGTLFLGNDDNVGLAPDDDRDSDWLDPEALYSAHHQIGDLVFHPRQE